VTGWNPACPVDVERPTTGLGMVPRYLADLSDTSRLISSVHASLLGSIELIFVFVADRTVCVDDHVEGEVGCVPTDPGLPPVEG
jgi:hypothetical protein